MLEVVLLEASSLEISLAEELERMELELAGVYLQPLPRDDVGVGDFDERKMDLRTD